VRRAASCAVQFVAHANGTVAERIPYGQESGWPRHPDIQPPARCHDCGVKLGGYHHYGCDNEECRLCGEQLIGHECQSEGQP
jgi:hypothetical protein